MRNPFDPIRMPVGVDVRAVLDAMGIPYYESPPPREFISTVVKVEPMAIPDFEPLLNYSYGTKTRA